MVYMAFSLTRFFFFFPFLHGVLVVACGTEFPNPGSNLGLLHKQDLRDLSINCSVCFLFGSQFKQTIRTCNLAIIKKLTRSKCWKECEEKGTFLCCWWGCKLMQPQRKTVWRFLKKTGNRTAIQPSNPTAGHTQRKPEMKETRVPQCSLQQYLQ